MGNVSNGDDCVSIVPSGDTAPPGPGPWPAHSFGGNVVVRDAVCKGGHGISIGSIQHGVVTNVSISNVTFVGSDNGARIKTYPNYSGLVSNISYHNVKMVNVKNPLLIAGLYCPKTQTPYPCPKGNVAVKIENVLFENFTGSSTSEVVGTFNCGHVSPCTGISLRHVNL